jgi:hypothetical protein
MSPEAVVQRQLEAYNSRNIDALLATYAEDAQIFEHPATLLANGAVSIRERFLTRFQTRFQEANLHATLLNRAVNLTQIVRRSVVLLNRWWRRVEDRNRLSIMSERELRDIGLSHQDADCEIRKPFWRE